MSAHLYKVTAHIKSPGSEPVDVTWATAVSAAEASAVVARIIANAEQSQDHMPAPVRFATLGISVEAVPDAVQVHMTETARLAGDDGFTVHCRCGWQSPAWTREHGRALGDAHLLLENTP